MLSPFFAIFVIFPTVFSIVPLQIVEQWRQVEFQFPTPRARDRAISLGYYITGNSYIKDFHVANNGSAIYVALPRTLRGVPFTLGRVSQTNGPLGPRLLPYPSYFWNNRQGDNCDILTSVTAIQGDICNRLWVIDTGKIADQQYCKPKLLAFNMANNLQVFHYQLPDNVLNENSLLTNMVLDVESFDNNCEKTYVYIADSSGEGLIVVDTNIQFAWRFSHFSMAPNPTFAVHTIAGVSFTSMSGINALGLQPSGDGVLERNLYYTPFSSNLLYFVDTKILKNYTFSIDIESDFGAQITQVPGARSSQLPSMAFDPSNRLYFGQYDPVNLVRWPLNQPYDPSNFEIVGDVSTNLEFVNSVKIFRGPSRFQVWVLSNRYQIFASDRYKNNEINIRIMRGALTDIDV